jgi:hypothetical protein
MGPSNIREIPTYEKKSIEYIYSRKNKNRIIYFMLAAVKSEIYYFQEFCVKKFKLNKISQFYAK